MSKTTEATKHSRRDFLKGFLLAGGALGTGVSLDVGAGTAAPLAQNKPTPAKRPGYRETEHVRTYYAKASL
jgi:transketolase N-terminal domain/subunit